jgi:CubicO group peptidase (beta-lactamase class C family)
MQNKMLGAVAICAVTLLCGGVTVYAQSSANARESNTAPDRQRSLADAVATEVQKAIKENEMPGCVVLINWQGKVVLREVYGDRQVEPTKEKMTIDTVFDLASLTKPVATATSVMILIERRRIKLDDPVAKYLPAFAAHGKESVTIEHLLLHTSGLIADNPLGDYEDGREAALEHICGLEPRARPGEKFVYSDVGFIVLGFIVEQVSGERLDDFARENIFQPLAMSETSFRPAESLRERAAPADKRDGKWLKGVVHDPRAALMDGVAGHAGLFSTADDLAKYAETMLNRGGRGDARLFSEDTWRLMTAPHVVPGGGKRALGWDVQSGYSTNRGKRLSTAAFGHGGFTGTSLWIDPENELFVIFLSNRLHPDGKGTVNPLAGKIAELAIEYQQRKQ